jgi:hypothetical protein
MTSSPGPSLPRIVRAGRNTLAPYDENPPDLTVGEDDILFLDLGNSTGMRRNGSATPAGNMAGPSRDT